MLLKDSSTGYNFDPSTGMAYDPRSGQQVGSIKDIWYHKGFNVDHKVMEVNNHLAQMEQQRNMQNYNTYPPNQQPGPSHGGFTTFDNNNMGGGTTVPSSPGGGRYDNVEIIRPDYESDTKHMQDEQPVNSVAKEEPVDLSNITNLEGHEHPPLLVPGATFKETIIGEHRKYDVIAENIEMLQKRIDPTKHRLLHDIDDYRAKTQELALSGGKLKDYLIDDMSGQKPGIAVSMNDIANHMKLIHLGENSDKDAVIKRMLFRKAYVTNTFGEQRTAHEMIFNMIASSENIIAFANKVKAIKSSPNLYQYICNEITNTFVLITTMVDGDAITVDSNIIEEIGPLVNEIADYGISNPEESSNFITLIGHVFMLMKNSLTYQNAIESKIVGAMCTFGFTYGYNVVSVNNENIAYELIKATAKICNSPDGNYGCGTIRPILMVKKDKTPFLHKLITDTYDVEQLNMISEGDNLYVVCQTRTHGMYAIKSIAT